MIDKKSGKFSFFVKMFDVMFIMILCFLTLFASMILRGAVIVGSNPASSIKYSFGIISFLITLIGFIVYLFYIIPNSDKELRNMINELYTNDTDSHG